MPMYTVQCSTCSSRETIWRRVDDRDKNLPFCCEISTSRIIVAPLLAPDFPEPYISPASGRLITSRNAQREELKKTGMLILEPGLKADIKLNAERAKEKAFEPIAAGVEEKVREMVQTGKIES